MTQENEVQEEIPVEETQTQEVVESQQEEAPPTRDVDKNWEQVHQVLKLQKQKIEELESRLAQPPAKLEEQEPDEFAELDPEDYLTVDKAKKLAEKMAEKKAKEAARQIVEEYARQQSLSSDEQRMRTKYDDYDYVIENYAIPLIKNDPALAYRIQQSKNPAETAYKLGKLSDSYEETTMKQQTSPKAEKIIKNSSRPVSSNAAGSSLKSQADQFSKLDPRNPQDAARIYEQAQRYARGA